jgi:hypothetical protein
VDCTGQLHMACNAQQAVHLPPRACYQGCSIAETQGSLEAVHVTWVFSMQSRACNPPHTTAGQLTPVPITAATWVLTWPQRHLAARACHHSLGHCRAQGSTCRAHAPQAPCIQQWCPSCRPVSGGSAANNAGVSGEVGGYVGVIIRQAVPAADAWAHAHGLVAVEG